MSIWSSAAPSGHIDTLHLKVRDPQAEGAEHCCSDIQNVSAGNICIVAINMMLITIATTSWG